MSKNIAQEVIKPSVSKVLRAVFLYTGQGDSTIVAIPTGEGADDYMYVLVDADLDKEENEVNLVSMLKDLLNGEELSTYINTHPHKDHTGGIKEIYDEIGITEVWHSNHSLTGEDKDSYEELLYVLKKVGKSNEYHLKGTNSLNQVRSSDDEDAEKKLGLIDYQIFAPAEYVCDEIDDEDERTRRNRIHEQCGVFKFTYGGKSIMFTGDANKDAWEKHITKYHKDNLKAEVTTASHHGSRTAFKNGKDDENPYKKHMEYIDAEHLIISAPKQKDSPHDHPHDDALEIYKEFFDEDKMYHLGETPYCIVVDIDADGNVTVSEDLKLIEAYGQGTSEEEEDDKAKESDNRAAVLKSYASNARPWRQ